MDLQGLLGALTSPEPGSINHELTKALVQARIAQLQQEAARDALRWARLSAIATAMSALIAVVALLIAIF